MRMIKLFVMLTVLAVMAVLPAAAQVVPFAYGPGFVDSVQWTSGTGTSAASDAFSNNIVSPFGGPFFGGAFGPCSPCGFGFPVGGLAQTGTGGNIGTQSSAMSTYGRSVAFGMVLPNELAFGMPVSGPSGLMYC